MYVRSETLKVRAIQAGVRFVHRYSQMALKRRSIEKEMGMVAKFKRSIQIPCCYPAITMHACAQFKFRVQMCMDNELENLSIYL